MSPGTIMPRCNHRTSHATTSRLSPSRRTAGRPTINIVRGCRDRSTIAIASLVIWMIFLMPAVAVDLDGAAFSTGPSTAMAQNNSDADKQAPELTPAQRQMAYANGFFQRGLYEFAAREYRTFLKEHPKDANASLARYALAHCLFRAGQPADAATLAAEALADRSFAQRQRAMHDLAQFHIAAGQDQQALAAIDAYLKAHSRTPEAEALSLTRAQTLYRLGDHAGAGQAAAAFLKTYRKSARRDAAMYVLGLSQLRAAQYADAARTFESLLREHKQTSHRVDALLAWGQAMEAQRDYEQAANRYRQMIEAAPPARKPDGVFSLAVVLYRAGDYPAAIEQFNTILKRFGESRHVDAARLQLGLSQFAASRIDDARRTLTAVAKQDESRQTVARYWLARCDMTQDRYEEARKTLAALAKLKPAPANLQRIQFDHAVCTMAMGQHQAAAGEFAAFVRAHAQHPLAPLAALRQAHCLHATGEYQPSLELCRQIAKQWKDSEAIRPAAELEAENLMMLSDFGRAEKAFAALLADTQQPDRRRGFQLRYAECAFRLDQWDATVERLNPIISAKNAARDAAGDDALRRAFLWYGDAQLSQGRHREAADALRAFLAAKPTRESLVLHARFKLARALVGAGDPDGARATLAELARGPNDSPWVRHGLLDYALLLHDADQDEPAAQAARRLLDTKPDAELAAPAVDLLAWIALDAGQDAQAAQRFAQLLADYPQQPLATPAAYHRGVALYRAGSWKDAAEAFALYIQRAPEGSHVRDAQLQRARCLAKQDAHDQAAAILARLADDKNAVSPDVLYELAWSRRALKQQAEAMAAYERLLSAYGDHTLASPARLELAEMRFGAGEYAAAAPLLETVVDDQAIAQAPRASALYRLARALAELNRPQQAAERYAAFARANPKDTLAPSALYQAGVHEASVQRWQQARALFERLLQEYPRHELAAAGKIKLGEVLAETGAHREAAEVYQRFLREHSKHEFVYLARFGVGWSLEQQKQYDQARQWYQQVVDDHSGPTAARAQFQIGETFFAQKQYAEAAAALLKVEILYSYPQWSSKALYEAGRAFEQAGQAQQAVNQYERCVKTFSQAEDPTVAATARLAKRRLDAINQGG